MVREMNKTVKIENDYKITIFEDGTIAREYIGEEIEEINRNEDILNLQDIILNEKLDYLTTLLELQGGF